LIVTHPVLGRQDRGAREWYARHALDAARDDDVHCARKDGLSGEVERLLRRTALTIDRRAGYRTRQLRGQNCVACDVHRLLADLHDAAHDDVLDGGRIDAGAVDKRVEDRGSQIDRMPAGETAAAPAAGRPYYVDDEGFGHVFFPRLLLEGASRTGGGMLGFPSQWVPSDKHEQRAGTRAASGRPRAIPPRRRCYAAFGVAERSVGTN
jgi:hypothetical protein